MKQRYQLGSVAMANAGPNTNGSQFFLISGSSGVGLPPQYNHFGQIVKGMEVLDAMQSVDTDRGDRPREDVVINSVDVNHFFDQFVATGAFDMTVFSYIGTSFPITGSIGIYQNKQGNSWNANFSRVGTAQIDNLMNAAVQATNSQDAIKNANAADKAMM